MAKHETVSEFDNNKERMKDEMDKFISELNSILPRYSLLLKQEELSDDEISELGEIEYFLIEISGRIHQAKRMLDNDLFGLSLDLYYKLKQRAKIGDIKAKKKLDQMRETFKESLKGETIILWN